MQLPLECTKYWNGEVPGWVIWHGGLVVKGLDCEPRGSWFQPYYVAIEIFFLFQAHLVLPHKLSIGFLHVILRGY